MFKLLILISFLSFAWGECENNSFKDIKTILRRKEREPRIYHLSLNPSCSKFPGFSNLNNQLIQKTIVETQECLTDLTQVDSNGVKKVFAESLLKKFTASLVNISAKPRTIVTITCEDTKKKEDYNAKTQYTQDITASPLVTFNVPNMTENSEYHSEEKKLNAEDLAERLTFIKRILSHEVFHLWFKHGLLQQREVAYPCSEYCFKAKSTTDKLLKVLKNACSMEFYAHPVFDVSEHAGNAAAEVAAGNFYIGTAEDELAVLKKGIKDTDKKNNREGKAFFFALLQYSTSIPEGIKLFLKDKFKIDPLKQYADQLEKAKDAVDIIINSKSLTQNPDSELANIIYDYFFPTPVLGAKMAATNICSRIDGFKDKSNAFLKPLASLVECPL